MWFERKCNEMKKREEHCIACYGADTDLKRVGKVLLDFSFFSNE